MNTSIISNPRTMYHSGFHILGFVRMREVLISLLDDVDSLVDTLKAHVRLPCSFQLMSAIRLKDVKASDREMRISLVALCMILLRYFDWFHDL